MPNESSNLSGQWSGEFSYPRHSGPTTPFVARIEDRGGWLTGTIVEPDMIYGGAAIGAVLSGSRHGSGVDFTKVYSPPPPRGYKRPVDYVGQVSSDGNTISGVWSVLTLDGTFEMRRDEEASEDIPLEETEAVPETLAIPAR